MNGEGSSMIASMCMRDASGTVIRFAPEKGCRERLGRGRVTRGRVAAATSLVVRPYGCAAECWVCEGKCLAVTAWRVAE
jgi:hypothetical protein